MSKRWKYAIWAMPLLTLLALALPWGSAVYVAARSQNHHSIALGYADGERHVITATIFPSGQGTLLEYAPNLSGRNGFFAKASEVTRPRFAGTSIWPPVVRNVANQRIILFHLGIPCAVLLILVVVPPLVFRWRRRRRRQSNRCVVCGYILAGSTSQVCTECGTTNHHVLIEEARP